MCRLLNQGIVFSVVLCFLQNTVVHGACDMGNRNSSSPFRDYLEHV